MSDDLLPAADTGNFLGSRESIAKYLVDHKAQVQAVARRKLDQRTRSVFDSEDIASSVFRRVDRFVSEGKLQACSEAQFWGLVNSIAENNAINRAQLIGRAKAFVREEGPYAQELLKRLMSYDDDDKAAQLVYRMLLFLGNERDRSILTFRLRGANHRVIAQIVGSTEGACRQRWTDVCELLREQFAQGRFD